MEERENVKIQIPKLYSIIVQCNRSGVLLGNYISTNTTDLDIGGPKSIF